MVAAGSDCEKINKQLGKNEKEEESKIMELNSCLKIFNWMKGNIVHVFEKINGRFITFEIISSKYLISSTDQNEIQIWNI